MIRRPRRWATLVVVAVAVAAVTVVGVRRQLASATPWFRVEQVRTDHQWTPDKPLFILLLGDDLRAGAGCGCTDAIHIVGVPAGGGSAVMLDIPRDARVAIPGKGMRKINEAYKAGLDVEAKVIHDLVGVTPNYVVTVGFDAFPAMVDEFGGVPIDLPARLYDANSGADFQAGHMVMDGRAALAYARARHIGRGDFTRTENQGRLLLAALAEVRSRTTSPADTMQMLALLARHTDLVNIGTADLYRLGRLATSLDPAQVRNVVMPGIGATIGGVSYVVTTPEAPGLFTDFADDAILQTH